MEIIFFTFVCTMFGALQGMQYPSQAALSLREQVVKITDDLCEEYLESLIAKKHLKEKLKSRSTVISPLQSSEFPKKRKASRLEQEECTPLSNVSTDSNEKEHHVSDNPSVKRKKIASESNRFNNPTLMQEHSNQKHGNNVCNHKIKNSQREKHKRFHDVSISAKCKCFTCEVGFQRPSDLKCHSKQVHFDELIQEQSKEDWVYETTTDNIEDESEVDTDVWRSYLDVGAMQQLEEKSNARNTVVTHNPAIQNQSWCEACACNIHGNSERAHELFHDKNVPINFKCFRCKTGYETLGRINSHLKNVHKIFTHTSEYEQFFKEQAKIARSLQ